MSDLSELGIMESMLTRRETAFPSYSALEFRGGPGEMEDFGENLARPIPTSNPDRDQEQGGLGVCGMYVASRGKERKQSRALGPVRATDQ
jgi:hypothetical protein